MATISPSKIARTERARKTYLGQRPGDDEIGDCRVIVITDDHRSYPLPHMVHHSPTGFEWGYGGSGPADLALSLLQDHLAEEKTEPIYQGKVGVRAWRLHQKFKWQVLQELGHQRWALTSDNIDAWLALQPVEVEP